MKALHTESARLTSPLVGRRVKVWTLMLTLAVSAALSGCVTRTANPPLPYIKPAYNVPEEDPGRVRIASRMEDMEGEMQRLRATIERLQASGGSAKVIADLQDRVAFIERHLGIEPPAAQPRIEPPRGGTPPPVGRPQVRDVPAPPPTDSPPVAPQPDPIQRVEIRNQPIPEDEKAFRDAYLLFRNGSFKEAVPSFEEFLKKYPKSPNAPDAVYWAGEALFNQGRYDEAVLQFDRVLKEYSGSKKS